MSQANVVTSYNSNRTYTPTNYKGRRGYLSIPHLKRRTILRPTPPFVIESRRRDIGMPQPLLDLGNIRPVLKGVRGRCGPERMHAEAVRIIRDPHLLRIVEYDTLIQGLRVQWLRQHPRPVILHRPEERSLEIGSVSCCIQIVLDQPLCERSHSHEPDFLAFAPLSAHLKVHDAFSAVHVFHSKQTHFFSTQPVIEEGSEDRPVPLILDRVPLRRFQERTGLGIAQGRRLAFIRSLAWPLDAGHGVVGDRVGITEVHKERGEGREGAPNTCVRPLARKQRIAPGDHMRPGDDPKLFGALDAYEPHEVLHVTFVRPPRLLVADIPKPLHGRRHLGKPVELGGRERPRVPLDDEGLVIVFLPLTFLQAFTHDNLFYHR
jgi:hypothetical protein